jgi:7-carboxy-7-deazaguanine synthase
VRPYPGNEQPIVDNSAMRIAEIFRSIQGEGRLTGTESVFVRASGCNLRCAYCDTPYASWSPEGDDLSVEEIAARVEELDGRHVVLTGGEPMLFAELIPLTAELRRRGRHITVETAGTLYLPVECDLMSVSPKLSNSVPAPERDSHWNRRHNRSRYAPQVLRRLVAEYDYQVKFVIDRPEDCPEVEAYLSEFSELDRARVMLMPQGTDPRLLAEKAVWLEPYCARHGLRFCPRRQIEWFGAQRGT